MKEVIGGYFGFEKELFLQESPSVYPLVDCGRSALFWILNDSRPEKIYLPFFSCHVLLDVLRQLNIRWEFLSLNSDFEVEQIPFLRENEVLIYINFFGLKEAYAKKLSVQLGTQVIIDNTHSLFSSGYESSWSFNSLRKFFGLPDGAQILGPKGTSADINHLEVNSHYRFEHLTKRLEGCVEEGYAIFKENEAMTWKHRSCRQISNMGRLLFSGLDSAYVREQRRSNFYFLHKALGSTNQLSASLFSDPEAVPFSYPYLPFRPIEHESLWDAKIFAPKLWPECIGPQTEFFNEHRWASSILHLPIDHRYSEDEMGRILSVIEDLEE
jgi:hypothetical protein